MEKQSTYNPWRNLLTKCRLLLNADLRLTEPQLLAHQWTLLAKIADQTVLLGKGGVNSMFYRFGDSERKICGPMDLIDLLKRRAKNKYVAYKINGKRVVWVEKAALKVAPKKGYTIHGVLPNGKEQQLYDVASTIQGVEWRKLGRSAKKSVK